MYQKELLKGNTETLLLSLLTQKPMYGYQIVKEMEHRSSGYFRFKEGTLYPALHRMEEEGWLRSEWGTTEKNRQARFYSLTPEGAKQLQRELESWERLTEGVGRVIADA